MENTAFRSGVPGEFAGSTNYDLGRARDKLVRPPQSDVQNTRKYIRWAPSRKWPPRLSRSRQSKKIGGRKNRQWRSQQ